MRQNPDRTTDSRIKTIIYRIEDGVLVGMLLLMIGIAVLQIVLRNAFGTGISWGDTLVRMLVLWIGMSGATVASRTGNHINIDVITRYLPKRIKTGAFCLMNLFAAGVCGVMAQVSLSFVRTEYEFGEIAFANIPSWACQSVIPLAFIMMALRYLILSAAEFQNLIKPVPSC